MATPAMLRRHRIAPSLFHLLTRHNPNPQSPLPPTLLDSHLSSFHHSPFLGPNYRRRCFSSRPFDPEIPSLTHMMTSRTVWDLETLGYRDGAAAAAGVGDGGGVGFYESFLPARGLVALLDEVRDLTGLPCSVGLWLLYCVLAGQIMARLFLAELATEVAVSCLRWIIIASSTLALRVTMLPLIILQLHKQKVIGQLFPKLPPPFPPPFSGKSIRDQFSV